eukprot:15406895-Heterocapsa_arctica.AAC.2
MSSVRSVDSDDPTAMLYLGVARKSAAVPTDVARGGASPAGTGCCCAARVSLSGGSCAACLAAIAIWAPIPRSIRRKAGFSCGNERQLPREPGLIPKGPPHVAQGTLDLIQPSLGRIVPAESGEAQLQAVSHFLSQLAVLAGANGADFARHHDVAVKIGVPSHRALRAASCLESRGQERAFEAAARFPH